MSKKWTTLLFTVLLTMAACSNDDTKAPEEGEQAPENGAEQTESGDVALTEIPDVVAKVNDTEIQKDRLEDQIEAQLGQYGQTVEDAPNEQLNQMYYSAAQSLVNEELLLTASADFKPSDEEINAAWTKEAEQIGGEDKLKQGIEQANFTEDEYRGLLAERIQVENYVADRTGEVEVTDEEAKEFYDQQSLILGGAQGEGGEGEGAEGEATLPPFEEVKETIVAQLKQQKQGEQTSDIIEELRADSSIEVFIEEPEAPAMPGAPQEEANENA
ncbi:hypothetical protein G4V62_02935 [Bacillaceae bacterium SIJ1]|uniref:SurA N-terminal domain-containing protein n=1 Tax=Litoribacterium kuwaitense TaxID=1398745 RepID=UPI0013EA6236|nr:SurA N-terminal domain-containing protein [Litoribacterium kuwaitense]NGP43954.1 hypothetical protein [Litoribacterium kuwaitense]